MEEQFQEIGSVDEKTLPVEMLGNGESIAEQNCTMECLFSRQSSSDSGSEVMRIIIK